MKLRTMLAWLVLAFVISSSLSSCSFRKVAYGFADNWIVSAVDDSFDLTSSQDDFVSERAELFMEWHRKNELPRLRSSLLLLKKKVEDKENVEVTLEWAALQMHQMWVRLVDRAFPDVVEFLDQVEPRQYQNVAEQNKDRNETRFERFRLLAESETEYIDWRLDRFQDRLESWLGDLSPAQVQIVREHIISTQSLDVANHRLSLRRQQEFVEQFPQLKQRQQIVTHLRRFLSAPRASGVEAKKLLLESEKMDTRARLRVKTFVAIRRICEQMTDAQRLHLTAEIADLVEDIQELQGEI